MRISLRTFGENAFGGLSMAWKVSNSFGCQLVCNLQLMFWLPFENTIFVKHSSGEPLFRSPGRDTILYLTDGEVVDITSLICTKLDRKAYRYWINPYVWGGESEAQQSLHSAVKSLNLGKAYPYWIYQRSSRALGIIS